MTNEAYIGDSTLVALGLYLVRSSALVVASPTFTRLGFASFKIALIVVLAGVMYSIGDVQQVEVANGGRFALLALREAMIGLSMAFLVQVALLAARIGGELVGLEMGIQMGAQVDPVTGVSTPLVARYFEEVMLVGLFAMNGHHWLVRALAESYERAPIGHLTFANGMVDLLLSFFHEMFAAGIAFIAPILVLMALVSLVVGLLARTVPQINVLELSFTLRIGVALVGLLFFAPALEVLAGTVMTALDEWLRAFLDLLEA
ncbi:MAG: flagellar biosynthetic protein FliR [Planctomycetota bacterium]